MKIALYVPCWPPGLLANGIVTYAAQIVPVLRRLGHEVFVVTPFTSNGNDPYTVDLSKYRRPKSLWSKLVSKVFSVEHEDEALLSAIKDLVIRKKVDVLEVEESFGMSLGISRRKLLPVVVRLHGPWFMNGRFDKGRGHSASDYEREMTEGRAIGSADLVTSPSVSVLAAVKSHYEIELENGIIIPNALDVVPEVQRWNLETCDKDSLLYVGRFDEIKGGDLVIQAFAKLALLYPKLKLTFVGPDIGVATPGGKVCLLEEYSRSILSDDASMRLTYMGKLSHSEIADLRTKHFATLCASKMEIFPYTVLEAISYGCPIVATAVGGIPEMIQTGHNGLLVSSNDLKSMVAACRKIIDDRTLAARLGQQAWLDCGRLYGSERNVKMTMLAYQAAISNHTKPTK